MKRKIPETSRLANEQMSLEQKQKDWDMIVNALKVLGEASIQMIATFLNVDDNKISRRTKEMWNRENPILYKTGKRVLTKSNRWADTLGLTENIGKDIKPLHEGIIPAGKKTDRVRKKEPPVEHYAKNILNSQTQLF